MDLNQKSAFGPVHSRDASAMEAHRALRNSQTQTNPASLPAASIVQAIKRLEQLFERIRRNAGAAIGDSNHGLRDSAVLRLLQMNFDRCAFVRVTDGVADYILDRTVQQGCISAHSPDSGGNFAAYVATPRLRFELRIFRHIEHNVVEQNRRGGHALLTIFEARQSEQAANEFIEAAGFEFDALKHHRAFRSGALPGQAKRYIQARQGRSQFMRNVIEQTRLRFDQSLQ